MRLRPGEGLELIRIQIIVDGLGRIQTPRFIAEDTFRKLSFRLGIRN